jgi:primosomal protein N' (replication factor Y) (superfamily II helicase)
MPEVLDVAIPVGARKTFAYSVPPALRPRVVRGGRVLVPFGRKTVVGYAVGWSASDTAARYKLRPILEVLDTDPLFPASLVETAIWISQRYFTPPGDVLRALLPPGAEVKGVRTLRLTARARQLLEGGLRPVALKPSEERVLEALREVESTTIDELGKRWKIAQAASWVEALATAGWVELDAGIERASVREKVQLGARLLENSDRVRETLTSAQRRLFDVLLACDRPIPLQAALRQAAVTQAVANALSRLSVVEIAPLRISRLPLDLSSVQPRSSVLLTEDQQRVFGALCDLLRSGTPQRCLLHGVTGSGKTEIYLRLIAQALETGAAAILLVPEIGLTPMLSRIAASHFPDRVALLHSGMSAGERFDQWQRIRSGEAPVVVGTRSAVFAPLEALGLVIIDEEQDNSYKQDDAPFYHAREVAWHRLQQNRGLLLLGSATPSIESFHGAGAGGPLRLMVLPKRVEERPLPQVRLIDMRVEFQRAGRNTVISEALAEAIGLRLARGEQCIVLLNRRGFSRSLLCRGCGHVSNCPDCSISLTYHRGEQRLMCHYCGVERPVPERCEHCGGQYIHFVGVGTEQLEAILHSRFPSARIARMDRDSTRRKGSIRRILLDFAALKTDILVGTQMVAKGHDFHGVTLVGVVGADAGLAFPDFRSAERTFQLLTQVAGRAGRGTIPGEVIVQTFYPEHYALRYSKAQDYEGFFRHEIEFRQLLRYPPFVGLVQLLIRDRDALKAFRLGGKVADALRKAVAEARGGSPTQVLGPAAAPLEKLRGEYRVQILLKAADSEAAVQLLSRAFDELQAARTSLRNVRVDVDPVSLL